MFHLLLRFITFGGHSAHCAYHVPKVAVKYQSSSSSPTRTRSRHSLNGCTYSFSRVISHNERLRILSDYRRLNNVKIELVASDKISRQSCGIYNKSEPISRGGHYTFSCGNQEGRFIYISKLDSAHDRHLMTICEVLIHSHFRPKPEIQKMSTMQGITMTVFGN